MAKIILSILTFLLMLFPNCTRLQVEYRSREVARDITAANVVRAINARDIGTLEAMMCLNIKQNTSDLSGEIRKLINTIDGEIVEFTEESFGTYSANRNGGKSIHQTYLAIEFKTATVENYRIYILLENYNSFQPDEMGIRRIFVITADDPSDVLHIIVATNGLGEWHE